jgi:hypothetical protein
VAEHICHFLIVRWGEGFLPTTQHKLESSFEYCSFAFLSFVSILSPCSRNVFAGKQAHVSPIQLVQHCYSVLLWYKRAGKGWVDATIRIVLGMAHGGMYEYCDASTTKLSSYIV